MEEVRSWPGGLGYGGVVEVGFQVTPSSSQRTDRNRVSSIANRVVGSGSDHFAAAATSARARSATAPVLGGDIRDGPVARRDRCRHRLPELLGHPPRGRTAAEAG